MPLTPRTRSVAVPPPTLSVASSFARSCEPLRPKPPAGSLQLQFLSSAPRPSLREPVDEIGSPQPRQRSRSRPENPLRRYRQMGRRCEIQNSSDIADVVAGVFGELGGGDETDKVDHALEIGRARLGEVPTQVLAAQTD